MNYNSQIHFFSHIAKSFLGHCEERLRGIEYNADELIVIAYHGTPKKFIPNFEAQINFFKRNFNIISPEQLDDYYSGRLRSANGNLLVTFDDSLKNNLHAAKILDKYDIKAFFFIVPSFVNTPSEQQADYYIKNIRPFINPEIDSEREDFLALSPGDIRELIDKGHSIGSHTQTHTLVAAHSTLQNSEEEIAGSRTQLEQQFGIRVLSFCSNGDTLQSVDTKEKKLIENNYKFHFTTIPGLNAEKKDPLFIKRRNIECFWLHGALLYAIGKWDLKRWRIRTEQYLIR